MTEFPDSFAAWQHLRDRLGDAPRPVDTYGLADLAAQLVAVVESAKFPYKPIAAVLAEVTDDDVRAALTQLPHLHARVQMLEFDLRAVVQARGITDEPAAEPEHQKCICGHGMVSHSGADWSCTMCVVNGVLGCPTFQTGEDTDR